MKENKFRIILLVALMAAMLTMGCASTKMPVSSEVKGDWKSVTLEDGYVSYSLHAFVLDEVQKSVQSFKVEYTLEAEGDSHCDEWQIWTREDGTFVKRAKLSLPDGKTAGTKTVVPADTIDFDAVVITPITTAEDEAFSWSTQMKITDLEYGSASPASAKSQKSAENGGRVSGSWISVSLEQGYDKYDVNAYKLDTALRDCISFDIAANVEMKANTKCSDWTVWIRESGTFVKAGCLYLSNGGGKVTKTVYFSSPRSFDAVALTPVRSGSYFWSQEMTISNPAFSEDYSIPSINSIYSRDDAPEGDWEAVKISEGGYVYTLHAFAYKEKIAGCRSFNIAVDVELDPGASCNDWQVWLRSNGTFVKAGTIYIPDGEYAAIENIHFATPISFDAVVVTPLTMGNFSWNMLSVIYDIQTK